MRRYRFISFDNFVYTAYASSIAEAQSVISATWHVDKNYIKLFTITK